MSPPTLPPPGSWSTGLCGCFEDINSCCCTFCCPCVVVGRNAEIVSDGFTDSCTACCIWYLIQAFVGCGCLYSMGFRSRLRQKYLLPPAPCGDCLVHFCCLGCALCQETRELKNRGWTPSIGYAANVRRFQASSQAPAAQDMSR